MWYVADEIRKTIAEQNLTTPELRICDDSEAKAVYKKADEIFVKGNPRVWWLSLRRPFKAYPYLNDDGCLHLAEYIPPGNPSFWFIPETDTEEIMVFEVTVEAVVTIVDETVGFEYNLVGKNFDWLIIENDHGDIITSFRDDQ